MPDDAYEKARAQILAASRRARTLDLSNNLLTALPPEITRLMALQRLDLRNNHLTALPPEITRLTALQGLFLGNNQLTVLPPEITRLTALQCLGLRNNRLRALPRVLGTLTSLQRAAVVDTSAGLLVEDNPLPDPYPSLIAPGQPDATRNILAYLRGERPGLPPANPPEPEPQPSIPPPRPAAIRVSRKNNRLTIASTPSPTDFNAAAMRAAIAALKTSIADLLADATADTSNFDRRALAAITRAQERLPKGRMTTTALFQLAHLHEILGHHAQIVADEWPEFLAAQFAAMRGNLALVVAHFAEWQAFKNTQPRIKLPPEQAKATPGIAQALSEELRTPGIPTGRGPQHPGSPGPTRRTAGLHRPSLRRRRGTGPPCPRHPRIHQQHPQTHRRHRHGQHPGLRQPHRRHGQRLRQGSPQGAGE